MPSKLKPKGTFPSMSKDIRRNKIVRDDRKGDHGESQEELLRAVPSLKNRNNVSAFENGQLEMGIQQAVDVADHYGCTLDALFSRDATGYGKISYNQIQMYEISPAPDNSFTIAKSYKGTHYNFREKIRQNSPIMAFRLRKGVSALNLKTDDILIVDNDWTHYINKKMIGKFIVIMLYEGKLRDKDFNFYYVTEMETIYDYANIKASKAVMFINQDKQKEIREISDLEGKMYGVVVQTIRYLV